MVNSTPPKTKRTATQRECVASLAEQDDGALVSLVRENLSVKTSHGKAARSADRRLTTTSPLWGVRFPTHAAQGYRPKRRSYVAPAPKGLCLCRFARRWRTRKGAWLWVSRSYVARAVCLRKPQAFMTDAEKTPLAFTSSKISSRLKRSQKGSLQTFEKGFRLVENEKEQRISHFFIALGYIHLIL